MQIRVNSSAYPKRAVAAIPEQFKPIGVEVTLLNTDTKTHYGHLEQKGDFDIARAGWIADYKDPETFLGISRRATSNNYAQYSSDEFEDLMNKAAAAGGNAAERMKLLSQAEAVLMRDHGQVPLLYYSFHNLVSSKLKGFEDNVMNVHPTRFIRKE